MYKLTAMTFFCVAALPLTLTAQESVEPQTEPVQQRLRDLSPEQRRIAYEAMSDEEKKAVQERRRAARQKQRAEWKTMTPEQREARNAEMRARREAMTPEQREAMQEMQKSTAEKRKGRRKGSAKSDEDENH